MRLIRKEFIMTDPPVPECHASTIVKLGAEEEAAAWFAGTKEGENDVMIWCSRRENGVWTPPRRIPSAEGIPHWNPVLFAMEGRLRLFYKIGYTIPDWKTMYTDSFDGGATWSEERELVLGDESGGHGPVKNKPIRLSCGAVLAPGSTERGEWKCFADMFRGDGWSKREIPSEKCVSFSRRSGNPHRDRFTVLCVPTAGGSTAPIPRTAVKAGAWHIPRRCPTITAVWIAS